MWLLRLEVMYLIVFDFFSDLNNHMWLEYPIEQCSSRVLTLDMVYTLSNLFITVFQSTVYFFFQIV